MPPQYLNLNGYGTESGVSAPQAQNLAFLGHKSVKIALFFSGSLCTSFGKNLRGGGGLIYITALSGPARGRLSPLPSPPPLDPLVSLT